MSKANQRPRGDVTDLTEKIRELINTTEECPKCDNSGSYGEGSPYDSFEVEQVQCDFCYTNPNSKFNMASRIQSLISQEVEKEKKAYALDVVEKMHEHYFDLCAKETAIEDLAHTFINANKLESMFKKARKELGG